VSVELRAHDTDLEIDLLLEAIFRKYQYDFRQYSRASLRRRVAHALETLEVESPSVLQHRILRDPSLFQSLLRFFTVHVSEMFRDPGFFRALREQVVPHLRTWPSLKIWSAGCSTGEEIYSLAILLEEEGLLDRTILYGTDISQEALRTAERGIYDLQRIASFTQNYQQAGGRRSLSDYYTAAYGGAAFNRRLLSHVVFSDHSLATDSVFAEVQLITCRNVLIYFDRPLQSRAFGLFKDALVHGGFLGLGSRESLRFSDHHEAFSDFDTTQRLYRRRATC
jgi:chemotaxis protein methyltransferase CheR